MSERALQPQPEVDRLFSEVPIPTAILSGPRLVFETCNAAFSETVGGRDVIGRPLLEALPELCRQGLEEVLHQVMRRGAPHVGRETPLRVMRNGVLEEAYFTFIFSPLRSADGSVRRVIAIVNDVTEQVTARKRFEQLAADARESVRELEDFVENATVAMHWVGPDGTILWANRAELEMLGYAREEYVGRNIVDFHADREVIEDILERLRRDEKLASREATLVCKDGALRHVLIDSSVRWQDGRFLHTQCFTRDVTERKRAEDALRLSEARYREIFETAGVSIWEEDFTAVIAFIDVLKKRGVTDFRAHLEAYPEIVREAIRLVRVVDVNAASLRMFGAQRKEDLLESLERIFTAETEAAFREEMIALAEARPRYEGEAVLRTLQGRRLDVQLAITFPPEGRPANKVLVTLTDVTPRKEAERRLERELAAARRLQETSVQLLEHADARTIYGQICEAAREIMGAQFSSMQMLHPERGPKGELNLLAMSGFAPPAERIWEWVRADSTCSCGEALRAGRRVIVADVESEPFMAGTEDQRALLAAGIRAAQSTPLRARDGSLLGMITTHWSRPHQPAEHELRLMDVLARQAADLIERAKTMRALVEADRRKDEFLAILSHELRNPLAPIRNAVTLLRGAPEDPAVRREALPVLERQVAHLIRLIDDLLDVARINRGDVELQKRVVTLGEIVHAAVETSRPLIDARRHALRVDLGAVPAAVLGDPVRLSQVVSNVLNNAANYTPEGGRIDVLARAENGRAVIRVRDSGPGIAPETAQSIFELFIRGDAARNHPAGFGIGLALARRLVEMHAGTIEAWSPGPGQGSEFVIRLPLEASPRPATAAPRPALPGGDGKRVLIVDDNVDAADSLGLVLRTMGAQVRVVNDGSAALEAFEAEEPSLVLLDIGMPGMSGYEVAREIRARFPQRRAALVALTGWGQPEDRRRAEEAGFDHHLVKPAEPGALERILAESENAAGGAAGT